jgi:cardiolipin-specific phospholipase
MSNWCRFSPEILDRTENRLIELSGTVVTRKRISIGCGNYLFYLVCGDESKPVMILLHGYCGSGIIFYRILKELSEHFHVFLVDMLGMGRSSRPEWTADTLEEAEDFFVESIEAFRKAVKINRFILAGHSFGGYVAGCYSLKYPEHVIQLLLLSPVGIPEKPSGFNFISSLKSRPWAFRAIWKTIAFLWVRNITPGSLLRKAGPLSGKLIKVYTDRKLITLPPEEKELIERYLEQINLLPGSGEYGLIHVLEPGAWARYPLCNRLPQLNIPMAFIYGDRDWMPASGGYTVAERARVPVLVKIIKDSDHHLYWDNSKDFVKELIESVYDLELMRSSFANS